MQRKILFTLLTSIAVLMEQCAIAQSSIAVTTLSNCKTQIVTLNCGNNNNNETHTASFPISTNQVVIINSFIGYGDIYFATANNVTNDLDLNGSPQQPLSYSQLPATLTGVNSFSIVNNPNNTLNFAVTLAVLTPSTNTVSVTPVNSVVIPSDATGNVQIILESSSDMVNWIPSQAGTYGNTYSNRFFRVRALAQ